MLTLEEFRATRTRVKDLAPYFGVDRDGSAPTPGYVYTQDCYLVILAGSRVERTYLGIGPKEWTTSDLGAQEERLYSGWYRLEHAGEGQVS